MLQWVHGPQTVVMALDAVRDVAKIFASMGPRSSDRGYAVNCPSPEVVRIPLQWVHGPQTVVMQVYDHDRASHNNGFNGSTVLRPWLWTIVGAQE